MSFKLNSQITPKWMEERLYLLPEWFFGELVEAVQGFKKELEAGNFELCLCAAYLRSPTYGNISAVVEWGLNNLESLGYKFTALEWQRIHNKQLLKYKDYGGTGDVYVFHKSRDLVGEIVSGSKKSPLKDLAQYVNPYIRELHPHYKRDYEDLQFFDLISSLRRIFTGEQFKVAPFKNLCRIPMGFFMESTKQRGFMNWNDSPFN